MPVMLNYILSVAFQSQRYLLEYVQAFAYFHLQNAYDAIYNVK